MQDNPLRPLIMRALERPEALPASLGHLALEFGETTGDDDVLTALAKRLDIPTEVRDKLAGIPAVSVRVAYLSRPDIDPEVRRSVLDSETRGTVLALLAEDPDTDPATLEALATHKVNKVLVALIANTHAPITARRTALITLDARKASLTGSQPGTVANLLAYDTDGHEEYASTLTSPERLRMIAASAHVGEAGLRRIADVLVFGGLERLAESTAKTHVRNEMGSTIASDIGALLLSPVLPDDLLEQFAPVLETVASYKTNYNGAHDTASSRLAARRDGTLGDDIRRARESTDPAELAVIASRPDQDLAVLLEVACNRASDLATTTSAVAKFHSARVVKARADQPDVIFALWEAGYSALTMTWTPRAHEIDLAVRMLHSQKAQSSAKVQLVGRMVRAECLPNGAVGALPLEVFATGLASTNLRDLAADRLGEALEANPVAVEVLIGMSSGFSGNLDEFLELCGFLDVGRDPGPEPETESLDLDTSGPQCPDDPCHQVDSEDLVSAGDLRLF